MLKKILPILAVSVWAVSGIADDGAKGAKFPDAESSSVYTDLDDDLVIDTEAEEFVDDDSFEEELAQSPEFDEEDSDFAEEDLAVIEEADAEIEQPQVAKQLPKPEKKQELRVAKRNSTPTQSNDMNDDSDMDDSCETQTCTAPCEPCPSPCPTVESTPKEPRQLPCLRRVPKACKPACCPPPACCWSFNPCNPRGCSDMDCGGYYFNADFLYWRAENHGFSYAYELTASGGQNEGKVVRVDPSWRPGFRIGAGWNSKYDFWDVLINYTWYLNKAHSNKSGGNGFIQLWPLSTSANAEFTTAKGKTRFMFNLGDLEMGRLTYLTKSIAVRPHIGIRGGTIHQKFNSTLTGNFPGEANSQETFEGKNNYWGLGPRIGVNGEWHVGYRFAFLGRITSALLYGENCVRTKAERINASTNAAGLTSQYQDDYYQLVPNLQMVFGFQWQRCFWCEQMFFKANVNWEANYWWNQFNLPVGLSGFSAPFPTVGNQPLTTEGLTINFEWGY